MTLDATQPPVGTVRSAPDPASHAQERREIRFTGWLGLLRALTELIESED